VAQVYEQHQFAVPEDATEILLVRHGASAAAVPGEPFELLEGHADPPLAEKGVAQAELTARRLAREPLRAVFVTTLQRTHQTAAPLVARTGLEPQVVPQLREVNLGEWEGGEYRRRIVERDPLVLEMLRTERWDVIPGAEDPDVFSARVREGIDEVVRRSGPGIVAVFAHGGVIAEVCRQAAGSRPFAFLIVDNCSISRLVAFADGRRRLRTFNSTEHLA